MPSTPIDDAWLAETLRSIGAAIIATDNQSSIVWMNPAAESLTGVRMEEAVGLSLVDVLALYDENTGLPAVSPVYRLFELGETQQPAAGCYKFRHRSGVEQPLEISCFRNGSAESSGTILLCRALASQRAQEDRRIQLQRLEAIAGLAGGLAHDLNNFLTIIIGYADELRRSKGLADQTAVNEIKQAATATRSITRYLESISGSVPNHSELLVLSDLLREMQGVIARIAGDACTLRLVEDPFKAKVQADRNLLRQVLSTIAVFARDAMPRGGDFRIEASSAEILDPGEIAGLTRMGSYARLHILLSRADVDAETLSHLFEPQCVRSKVGFSQNLGLSVARGIVTQLGGHIHATSTPGSGTTIEILLPRVYQFRTSDAAAVPEPVTGDDAPLTVLLVEDDDSVRRVVHNYMERAGFNLLEAANAEEAVDLAEVYDGVIQVLVTDVVLPGMSGRELAQKLRSVRPEIKVLLVSGFPRTTLIHTGPNTGHRFLAKPFTADELLECVRGLMLDVGQPTT